MIPLLIIAGIVLAIFVLMLLPFIVTIMKILLMIGALVWIISILKKNFKTKKMANWEFIVIAISVGAGLLTLGSHFQLFSVGLPMAIQQPLIQATLSPINLFLVFIIFVLALMYIYKK